MRGRLQGFVTIVERGGLVSRLGGDTSVTTRERGVILRRALQDFRPLKVRRDVAHIEIRQADAELPGRLGKEWCLVGHDPRKCTADEPRPEIPQLPERHRVKGAGRYI